MIVEEHVSESTKIYTIASKNFPVNRKTTEGKKVRGSDSQLYTSICPIVYATRIFGLAPYEFQNDSLVPSSINCIYSYACLVIYTYIIYTVMSNFMGLDRLKPLLGHTELGKAILNYLITTLDIVTTIFRRGEFARIWNMMQDYDEIVKNLGYARNETKTCILSWIILCTTVITWTAVSRLGMLAFNEAFLPNFLYLLIYVGSSMSVIKFSGLTLLLGQRFNQLNVIAKKNGPSSSRCFLVCPDVNPKDIENLHNTLMIASECLNCLYSWPLLFWFGNLGFHIVSDFFYVIQRMIIASWTWTLWRVLACLISWILAFLAQMMFLCYACDFTSSEANDMGSIMISWKRWLKKARSYRGRYENVETSIHLINRRLNFSAAGCFCVNLPLLRSIASLLATYLVILLQFPE